MSVQSQRTMPSEHLRHDRLLIARYAAGDSYPTEVEEARALIAACTECAALADDIRVVSRAMAQMPVPARPRDFRITAEQADRLRGSWLERVMRRFAGPGLGTLRPVAGVALSIGLVMAVAGTMPSLAPAGPATDLEIGFPAATQGEFGASREDSPAPPQDGLGAAPNATPAAMESAGGAPMGPVTTATDDGGPVAAPGDAATASGAPEPMNQEFNEAHSATPGADVERMQIPASDARASSTGSLLTYSGMLIALASLGLLILAGIARRRYSDRLLR